jgi:hypothetical protein
MAHKSKDDIGETREDIEKLLSEHSKLIIKEIKRIGEGEVEIFLVEPTLPRDFRAFVQRLVIIVNEMGAEETIYRPETNSISFWYD